MDVGKRITKLRKKLGLSTNKLATMAGIAQSALRSIELGEKSPTIDTLKLILAALNITEAEFFAPPSEKRELKEIDQELLELARKIKNFRLRNGRRLKYWFKWMKKLLRNNNKLN